jgi:hypothetical protein
MSGPKPSFKKRHSEKIRLRLAGILPPGRERTGVRRIARLFTALGKSLVGRISRLWGG